MLTFTEAKEVPNKTNPDKEPWLSLGCQSGKRTLDFTFGAKKAYAILSELDDMNKAYADFKADAANAEELFEYNVTLNAGTKWETPFQITEPKLELINHYRADIEKYLEQHPFTPFKRVAIAEPSVTTEVVGIDYCKVLHLPCYAKSEHDEGEGLIEKRITQKSARFIIEKAFKTSEYGSSFAAFKVGIEKNLDKLTDNYKTQSGEVKPIDYSLEEMKCYVKYKSELMEFAMSGSLS